MSDPREAAQRRNEDARARADADPAAVADHATGANLPNLTARLAEWPVPGVDPGEMATARRDMVIRGEAGHDLDPDETAAADQWSTLTPFEQVERRVVAQRQHDHAEANQTAAWRAMMARDLAAQWVQREALAAVRWDKLNIRPPPMLGAAEVPARLVEHLAKLPERRGSDTGLSLLTVLVEALPLPVEHETRADRRIMPALRVIGPSTERERGRLVFGGLLDGRPREANLLLFPEREPHRYEVPLLDIAERAGLPFRSKGHGAPIESRLVVRGGLLSLRPEDRGRLVVRIAVTVGELLDALWPPSAGRGRPRDSTNWPRLLRALYRARDFHVPDATGGRWFPLAVRRLPDGVAHPWAETAETPGRRPGRDELIVLDLAPVPGAETGGSVDLPFLDRMGVSSGPRWFAYLAGRSLIWLPGKTRRPAPGGRYGWSRNPADYPVLTLADLRRFAFGAADKGDRARAAIVAPWEHLPDLVIVPDVTDARTGIRGWRLLPAEAEAALQNVRDGGRMRKASGRMRKASGRMRKDSAP